MDSSGRYGLHSLSLRSFDLRKDINDFSGSCSSGLRIVWNSPAAAGRRTTLPRGAARSGAERRSSNSFHCSGLAGSAFAVKAAGTTIRPSLASSNVHRTTGRVLGKWSISQELAGTRWAAKGRARPEDASAASGGFTSQGRGHRAAFSLR